MTKQQLLCGFGLTLTYNHLANSLILGIPVIIQQMTTCQYHGVLFTKNPANETAQEMLLELSTEVKGIAEGSIPFLRKTLPATGDLSSDNNWNGLEKELLKLRDFALQLVEKAQTEVDLELGIEQDKLIILQCRPISTLLRLADYCIVEQDDAEKCAKIDLAQCASLYRRYVGKQLLFRRIVRDLGFDLYRQIYVVYHKDKYREQIITDISKWMRTHQIIIDFGSHKSSSKCTLDELDQILRQYNVDQQDDLICVRIGEMIVAELSGYSSVVQDDKVLVEYVPGRMGRLRGGNSDATQITSSIRMIKVMPKYILLRYSGILLDTLTKFLAKDDENMTMVSLPYFSFLWPNMVQMKTWQAKERPSNSFITDLAIRQIIENLRLDQKSKWAVKELLYKPCVSSDVIKYRLDIMEDLINSDQLFQLFKDVILLIDKFQSSETFEAKRLNSTHQAARFFQRAMLYTDVIITLQNGLNKYKEEINSKGLELLSDLISQIANLDTFIKMQQEIMRLQNQAKDIQPINIYFNCKDEKIANLLIDNSSTETGESLTARLIQASQQISFLVSHEEVDVNQGSNFSSLEERLLEETLRVYPGYFKDLDKLKTKYQNYPMEHILPYSSELRFYTAMITMIKRLELHGFKFCKPQVMPEGDQRIQLNQVYDLSLAIRLAKDNQAVSSIVSNNHISDETGRVFILTGPNQGGKTTFLRSIGIALVLFQAGCFVPAERAVISPVDSIFTHFQEKEVLGVKKGRLGEEANRIAKIFHKATENSLILLNETFSSARRVDGYHLSKDVLKAMMKYRCQGIFVTHITELTQDVALLNEDVSDGSKLVNLVAGVVDLDGTGTQGERTYEIRRSIASTGLGYSRDITLKYGLTLEQLLSLFETRCLIKEEVSYEP